MSRVDSQRPDRTEAGDGVLLVVGSAAQRMREYLFASIGRRRPVWFFDSDEPTWQAPYIVGSTVVDVFDPDALVAAARAVARSEPVAGLFCYDEALILPSAHVIEALGLPGMDVATVERCRDKSMTRRALSEAGIPQPRSVAVRSLAEARSTAASIGYPLVLKPRALGASQGVVKVRDPSELQSAYAAARRAFYEGVPLYEDGVLVEEYMDGPEISVDGVVADGGYRPLFLARKRLGMAPYFEEIQHVVDAADPLLGDRDLLDTLAATHEALGIRRGITHTEVKLTSRGLRIVEVNGRFGGDLIPYIGGVVTGIDPGEVGVAIATGRRPELAPTRRRVGGIRFLYPPQDCVVVSVEVPDPDPAIGLFEADAITPAGTALRLPPKGYVPRYAFVICTADDPRTCEDRLEEAAGRVSLEWEPLTPESEAAAAFSPADLRYRKPKARV